MIEVDLSKVDVVMRYLLPELNVKLLPQLRKLKTGARIVSHAFAIKETKPDRVVTVQSAEDGLKRPLYLWITPLKNQE